INNTINFVLFIYIFLLSFLISTLFPYTTLFRSLVLAGRGDLEEVCVAARNDEREGRVLDGRVLEDDRVDVTLDVVDADERLSQRDRKSTRLNSRHHVNSYAVFCLKKKFELIQKA